MNQKEIQLSVPPANKLNIRETDDITLVKISEAELSKPQETSDYNTTYQTLQLSHGQPDDTTAHLC